MKKEQLSDAIGKISERHVSEAMMTDAAQVTYAKSRRVLRTSLVAAVIAALLVVIAGATFLLAPVLRNYFGESASYVYQKNSQILNLSQTVNDWTMTLTDCVGDDRFLYIGMELTAPEGTVLDDTGGGSTGLGVRDAQEKGFSPGYTLSQHSIAVKNSSAKTFGYISQLPDDDDSDNKLRFALWVKSSEPLDGKVLSLDIGKLYHVLSGPAGVKVSDFEGNWHYDDINLKLTDQTIRLKPNLTVPVLDTTATLTALSVSPISVSVYFEGTGLIGQQQRYPNSSNIENPTISLYDKQGNIVELARNRAPFGNRAQSGCNNDTGKLWIIESYETFVDLDALGAIEICGTSISLR